MTTQPLAPSALTPKTTTRGTPCPETWDTDWIQRVEAIEEKLDRRICGAPTPTGEPCRFAPSEERGRPARDCSALPSPLGRGAGGEGLPALPAACSLEPIASSSPPSKGAGGMYSSPPSKWAGGMSLPEACSLEPVASPSPSPCRYHGGANLCAGQPAFDNTSHGLYTRGLRPCGPSCPLWDKCPMVGDDVAQLQPPERPTCPYEAHDYRTAVQSFTQLLNPPLLDPDDYNPERDVLFDDDDEEPTEPQPYLVDLTHRVATLHVMVNRAAAAFRETDVIDRTIIHSQNYSASYAKPHAYLQAFLRLSSEYRRYLALLKQHAPEPRRRKIRPLWELFAEVAAKREQTPDPEVEARNRAADAELLKHCGYTDSQPPSPLACSAEAASRRRGRGAGGEGSSDFHQPGTLDATASSSPPSKGAGGMSLPEACSLEPIASSSPFRLRPEDEEYIRSAPPPPPNAKIYGLPPIDTPDPPLLSDCGPPPVSPTFDFHPSPPGRGAGGEGSPPTAYSLKPAASTSSPPGRGAGGEGSPPTACSLKPVASSSSPPGRGAGGEGSPAACSLKPVASDPPGRPDLAQPCLDKALDHRKHGRFQDAVTEYNYALDYCPKLAMPHYDDFEQISNRILPGPNRIPINPRGIYSDGKPFQIYGAPGLPVYGFRNANGPIP